MTHAVNFDTINWNTRPVPSLRRGACPTISSPMQTGDGLLARLRPRAPGLSLQQMMALADAALACGNGIIEVTARGSLQFRGLRPETVTAFNHAIAAADIEPTAGVAIETPPLSGLDPDELIDARELAEEIRVAVADLTDAMELAPKLSIVVDGGGQFHLGPVVADIRLTAWRDSGGQIRLLLSLGGDGRNSRRIALLEERQATPAVLHVLKTIAAKGPSARGRDITPADLGDYFPDNPVLDRIVLSEPSRSPGGVHDFGHAAFMVGVVLPYCQIDAGALQGLVAEAEKLGACDIRPAPGHALFLTGLSASNARALSKSAERLGFLSDAEDPRNHIALCAGSAGCASGFYDTKALAALVLAHASDLLDGSFALHLSGCVKGCAHPSAALITISGAPSGYGLVVNGAASAAPASYIGRDEMIAALGRLARLFRDCRQAGESARACLTRLGANRIAAQLQLDTK